MASDDPEFAAKAADVIDLYLRPASTRSGVLCRPRRPRFKPWIGWTRSCRFRGGWRGTDSKSKRVQQFLADHSQVHFHFTPTYSSWLNQVELWFSKIERDVIARGIFTSVTDLAQRLMHYIRQYNLEAKPIKWKYSDPSKRIQTIFTSSGTGH